MYVVNEPNSPVVVNSNSDRVMTSFGTQLAVWAITHNITHLAVRDLLQIISKNFPTCGLPKDPRTLLNTGKKPNFVEISGGKFFHFGIAQNIESRVKAGVRASVDQLSGHYTITLTIGVDGLPISRSSNMQFWPILGILDNSTNRRPFLISLYLGNSKPISVSEFLEPFVDEMLKLEQEGLIINGQKYIVTIRCIVADAPARSYVKACKGHNAYYSCERCQIKGRWNRRVTFPSVKLKEKRTDETFKSMIHSNHHNGESPLSSLKIGMVSQIVLDYMHLICLGVMRKMLIVWAKDTGPHRLSRVQIALVSETLLSYREHFPREFSRKPRSLKELDHWKATEFRSFLLYTGPSSLKGVLPKKKFRHFMLLHTAIYILELDPGVTVEWIDYAESLIAKM